MFEGDCVLHKTALAIFHALERNIHYLVKCFNATYIHVLENSDYFQPIYMR